MSFIKLSKNFLEYTTLVLHPDICYVSSSAGITGSQYINHIRTDRLKDFEDYLTTRTQTESRRLAGGQTAYYDSEREFTVRADSLYAGPNGTVDVLNPDNPEYLEAVNNSPVSFRQRKKILIDRILPGKTSSFTAADSIKNTIRKNLNPHYKVKYPDLGWHYSNYHTINFFKTDNLPDDSCLMYPNSGQQYTPDNAFSLCFNINPRYDNETPGAEFNAGTIFHLSSSIAVSLVSGSKVDKKGLVSSYKILLQLSQSADTNPDNINLTGPSSAYPNDLIYLSDVELSKNTWNHVTIRWSPNENNSSGSIVVNRRQNYFHVPSASLSTDSHGLIVGNYFNGNKSNLIKYFNTSKQTTEGVTAIDSAAIEPTRQSTELSHPLQAEVHNIMLLDKYVSDKELLFLDTFGVNNRKIKDSSVKSLYSRLLFFLPPYFIPESPERSNFIINPYANMITASIEPFNVPFSFSLGGRIINLENFVADFSSPKSLKFPRLQSLTASNITAAENVKIPINKFIFESSVSPQIKKRNLTILPNDNGLFHPDYYPIIASNHATSSFFKQTITSFVSKSDPGTALYNYSTFENIYDYSKISLENLTPFAKEYHRTFWAYNQNQIREVPPEDIPIFQTFPAIFGPYNNNTNIGTTPPATRYARHRRYAIPAITKDVSSNEIVIYDISQLYYGNSIKDKSFSIIDSNLSGSDGKIKIKLADNGHGSLYRADAFTPHAEWNNTGDIILEEGIINILSPHLINFCQDKTSVQFKGEQTLHTMIVNVPVFKNQINSSSNKTYVSNPPSTASNEEHLSTQYITAVNIHDNNFNIIMKAHFSQPIVKTDEDEFVIRLKQDF